MENQTKSAKHLLVGRRTHWQTFTGEGSKKVDDGKRTRATRFGHHSNEGRWGQCEGGGWEDDRKNHKYLFTQTTKGGSVYLSKVTSG